MQEISGRQEDILFDLEQIKLLSQEKDTLTDTDKDRIKRTSVKKRKAEKEAILKDKETRRKEAIRIWTLEVEEKVHHSNLPPEIKAQILEMTAYVKERNMTFMYNIEQKIEALQVQVREAEEREAQKKRDEMADKALKVAGAVVGAVALATVAEIGIEAYKEAHPEWYHVQYTPEKLNQASADYYNHTIAQELAEMKLPVAAEKTYSKKQGSQYTKAQDTVAANKEKDIMDFAYQQAKQSAEKVGKKIPEAAEFKEYWAKVPEVKKRAVQRKFAQEKPELAKKHEQDKLRTDKMALEKGIERLRRKHAQKEAKMMKGISKRLAGVKAEPKKTNHQILKAASQVTKSEERVREKAQALPEKAPEKPRIIKVDFAQIALKEKMREAG